MPGSSVASARRGESQVRAHPELTRLGRPRGGDEHPPEQEEQHRTILPKFCPPFSLCASVLLCKTLTSVLAATLTTDGDNWASPLIPKYRF